jgi:hypothetical protein
MLRAQDCNHPPRIRAAFEMALAISPLANQLFLLPPFPFDGIQLFAIAVWLSYPVT